MAYPNNMDQFQFAKDSMKTNGFRLSQLPFVAMREVFQFCTIPERIKLALTSKKMKRNISYSKIPNTKCEIRVSDEYSHIYFENEKLNLHCGRKPYRNSKFENLNKKELKSWFKEHGTIIENITELFRKVSEIMNLTSVIIVFDMENMKIITVEQVLSVPELNIWKCVMMDGRGIKKKELDMVMERANEKRSIAVNSVIPAGYIHQNMFKFHNFTYADASWLHVNHILSLRNKKGVLFTNTSLSFGDINKLVKGWIDSDNDIFKRLILMQKFPAVLEKPINAMLKDCVVMQTYRGENTSFFLVCASPTKLERKRKILCLFECEKGISLEAYFPDELVEHRRKSFTAFTKEFEILNVLNGIKQMEEEVKAIDSIVLVDIKEEEMKELIKKRRELKQQIRREQNKIEDEQVRFEDGFWKSTELN